MYPNFLFLVKRATSHKVEVNPEFSNHKPPQDILGSAQKMFRPQLYEKLLKRKHYNTNVYFC